MSFTLLSLRCFNIFVSHLLLSDFVMNSTYVCFLYIFNIYIIIDAESALDVILNALAFEFIIRLDEEITLSDWWDPQKRWITAGTMELIIQNTLRLDCLQSPKLFSKAFNIPEEEILEKCDRHPKLFLDEKQALEDENNPIFMNEDEKIKARCKEIAIELGNSNAIKEYEKSPVYFSLYERYLCCCHGNGMFQRYNHYRTWGRWENILYKSPVPDLKHFFETDDEGEPILSKKLDDIHHTKRKPFLNFSQNNTSHTRRFVRHSFEVLTFVHMIRGIISRLRNGQLKSSFLFFLDSVGQWIAFATQLVFPLYIIAVFCITCIYVFNH
uniref:Uncharacterized protein n=1 Tax=Ditylum brightwellii TaxID=49249 RepID=A0A7S4R4B5_9STRA